MELFLCPSRRPVQTYPVKSTPINCDPLTLAVRTDYAINCGDQERCQLDGGPTNVSDGRSKDWLQKYVTTNKMYDATKQLDTFTGISYPFSEVKAKLRDNDQYVYLAAEKWVNPSNYLNGTDPGDLYGAYTGFSASSSRSGFNSPWRDSAQFITGSSTCSFGGPHANNFHAVFCDGSVRAVRFGISILVHKNLANAFDGLPNPSDDQL
jgi:prepilin-type processing-associated H-X9-DG protein